MKKQTFSLKLKKAKIVNLNTLSHVDGGNSGNGGGQSEPSNLEVTCIGCTDFTDDKTNTNSSVPTIFVSFGCIP